MKDVSIAPATAEAEKRVDPCNLRVKHEGQDLPVIQSPELEGLYPHWGANTSDLLQFVRFPNKCTKVCS